MDNVETVNKDNDNDEVTFVDIVDGVGHIAKAIGNFADEILEVFR